MKKLSLLFMCALMCVYANAKMVNLSVQPVPSSGYGTITLENGDVLTGTLNGQTHPYKIVIKHGATIQINQVHINGYNGTNASVYPFAGLTCLGSATIELVDGNSITGFSCNYPGIYVPENYSLTIRAASSSPNASLDIKGGQSNPSSNYSSLAPAIGGGYFISCGQIKIQSGTITAHGGGMSAIIGGGQANAANEANCGMITIEGGTINAYHGGYGAGIGAGQNGTVGRITITGGTLNIEAGGPSAAIGGSENSTCATIDIASTVTRITAKRGSSEAPYCIGNGKNGSGANVKLGGVSKGSGVGTSSVYRYPECTAPTGVQATNISLNSATIKWTAGTTMQKKFDIAYHKQGVANISHKIVTNVNSASLTGLSSGATYFVQIKGYCSDETDDDSEYSAEIQFTTESPCQTVSNIRATDITATSAKINWDAMPNQIMWYIHYYIDGTDYGKNIIPVYTKPYPLTGLQPNTQYSVQIKSHCGVDNESEYTAIYKFNTASESNPCNTPGLQIMNVTSTSARLVWSYNSGMTFVDIAKANENFPNGRWVFDDYYDATGLEPNTRYKARVTSKCGDDVYSDASEIVYFTTLPDETPQECKQPTYLKYEDVTATSFKVTWTPGGTETKWYCRVMYRDQSGALYSGWANSPEKIFTDLDPMTDYTVTIEASCGDGVFSDQSFLYVTTSPSTEGVEEVTPSDSPSRGEKILRDGQLYIIVGDKMYDARGEEVK